MMNTARQDIDPITLTVLWSRLISIADDMGVALRRTAFSEAVREGDDFSTGLFDRKGRLVAQGNFTPGHLGAMPYVVRHVLSLFPAETLRPGDCVLLNDSFMGSGHYPDCFMVSPVFVDDLLFGFTVNCAHHVDMGGAVPGSQIVAATEAFQEGLRILPVKLVKEGEVQEEILRLILGNVRLPEIVKGDLIAQRNTNITGARWFATMATDYGIETMDTAVEEILTRSEARMRELIAGIPDGVYSFEDVMEDCGSYDVIRFHADVTVKGSDIEVDFSGSSDQVQAGINSYINYTRAYSAFAIKVFTDPYLPQNDGVVRPIHVTSRPGSLFNPSYPAPSSGRAVIQVRMFEVICGALAKVVPERAMAAFSHWSNPIVGGVDDRTGKRFIFYDLVLGGYGARAHKDGPDALCPVFNATNIPIEVHETHNPVLIHCLEFLPDTGGAGKFRGGCGVRKDVQILADKSVVSLSGDRHRFPPFGLFKGQPGARAKTLLNPHSGAIALSSKEVRELKRNDTISFQLSGGGGYGDPCERDPRAVLEDVLDGFVSAAEAERSYGVVIADGALDLDKTVALRAARQGGNP
jgi:N-methylhydantoinase B